MYVLKLVGMEAPNIRVSRKGTVRTCGRSSMTLDYPHRNVDLEPLYVCRLRVVVRQGLSVKSRFLETALEMNGN